MEAHTARPFRSIDGKRPIKVIDDDMKYQTSTGWRNHERTIRLRCQNQELETAWQANRQLRVNGRDGAGKVALLCRDTIERLPDIRRQTQGGDPGCA